MMTAKMMEALKTAGIANEWHKGDMHRLYIDLAKADEMYYDNNESLTSGRLALNRRERDNGKVWIDMETGEISTKGIGSADEVIAQIMELAAFLTPAETEETSETEEDNDMYIEHKNTTAAEYYYNDYIGMYCIVGTTLCNADFDELAELWASPELLTEIPMPDYITEDNCDDLLEW